MTAGPDGNGADKSCIPLTPAPSVPDTTYEQVTGGAQPSKEALRSWLYSHEGLPTWFTSWAQQSL
jgi:hypothetical protein